MPVINYSIAVNDNSTIQGLMDKLGGPNADKAQLAASIANVVAGAASSSGGQVLCTTAPTLQTDFPANILTVTFANVIEDTSVFRIGSIQMACVSTLPGALRFRRGANVAATVANIVAAWGTNGTNGTITAVAGTGIVTFTFNQYGIYGALIDTTDQATALVFGGWTTPVIDVSTTQYTIEATL